MARIVQVVLHPREVPFCVTEEIEVKRGNSALNQAPHCLPEIRHDLHQLEPSPLLARDTSEIVFEQIFFFSIPKVVIDAKICQIKEDVAHSGVFPVEDAD